MEAAAAAAGFASLAFTVFQGCIKAIIFFNTAQSIGVDGDLFRIGLEVQRYRLVKWGEKVGLLEGMTQNERVHWDLATSILEQLSSFLTSAGQLSRRYSLVVTEEDVEESEKERAGLPPKQGLAKVLARLKPEVYTASSRIIQSSNGTIKRLRWASVGKDKGKRILDEISKLIDHLELLLDSADQERRAIEDGRLLRDLVSFATTTVEAGQVRDIIGESPNQDNKEAIREAAWAKQVRLVIGADKREDEVQPKSASETRAFMPQLRVFRKPLQPWQGGTLRKQGIEFAMYKDKQVLVQWKVAEGTEWAKYEENTKRLAVLLMSLSHQSFRALPCDGYYPAMSQGRHGVIFAMPGEGSAWAMKNLKELVAKEKYVSLSRRIAICRALAQAVLQLHTSGWMHKSLRPENIVFFAPEGSDNEAFLRGDPYIMGYDYARPDSAGAAAITQLPETELLAELYRHPDARGSLRQTYQKRFDMYALGCVLIELAMWESLVDLHSRLASKDLRAAFTLAATANDVVEVPSMQDLINGSQVAEAIQHQVGETFVDAVMTCLTMERIEDAEETGMNDQVTVVEKLAKCQV